jgi:hypothetical protein
LLSDTFFFDKKERLLAGKTYIFVTL